MGRKTRKAEIFHTTKAGLSSFLQPYHFFYKRKSTEGCDHEDCEGADAGERDDDDDLFELDLEAFSFDDNDLPVKSFYVSTTIDRLPSEMDEYICNGSDQEASSSEGDSSYIEFISPLASPQPGFLQEVFAAENRFSDASRRGSRRQSCCRVSCIHVKRMPPTLGHLKLRRKPKTKSPEHVQPTNHDTSLRKHNAVCCPFRNGYGSMGKKEDKPRLG